MTEKKEKSDKIKLIEIIQKLWTGRKTILMSTGIGLTFGIFLLIISPRNYTSESTLLIETEATVEPGMTDLLQQIAASAGIMVNQKQINNALTPDLYPLITNSTPFLLEVLSQRVIIPENNREITVSEYLEIHPPNSLKSIIVGYTIGLPSKIIGLFSQDEDTIDNKDKTKVEFSRRQNIDTIGNNDNYSNVGQFLNLSMSQLNAIKKIQACIDVSASSNLKKAITTIPNILRIITTVHNPEVASQLNVIVINCLTKFIADYRTRKVKNDLEFITTQCDEAKNKYEKAQQVLANYNDRVQHVVFNSSKTQEARLQSDNDIAFAVFNSLSQVKAQAKIKVQEQTPVFTTIDPPGRAIKESSKSVIILFCLIFLGFIFGSGIIYLKSNVSYLKSFTNF